MAPVQFFPKSVESNKFRKLLSIRRSLYSRRSFSYALVADGAVFFLRLLIIGAGWLKHVGHIGACLGDSLIPPLVIVGLNIRISWTRFLTLRSS